MKNKVPECQSATGPKCQRARVLHLGPVAPWPRGTLAPWHLGPVAPWPRGTLAPWHLVGPVAPWPRGTLSAPWHHSTVAPLAP